MSAYRSRVEIKKEKRKKILFWGFIIAYNLFWIWIGIIVFNNSTNAIEGEITPREELLFEEGAVTDWKYVYSTGSKYTSSEHYFSIELDNGNTYVVTRWIIDVFARKRFEQFGMGSQITLLLDENKGYKGREGRLEIAEIRCGDTYYLRYEDYVYQKMRAKEFMSKIRWPITISVPLMFIGLPSYFIIKDWWKKRNKNRNLPYRTRK